MKNSDIASKIISVIQILYDLICNDIIFFFETQNNYTDAFYSLAHYLANSTNFQFNNTDLIFYE
jgi:hypothetical protein